MQLSLASVAALCLALAGPADAQTSQAPVGSGATPSSIAENRPIGEWEGEVPRADAWPLFLQIRLEEGATGTGGHLRMLGSRIEFVRAEKTGAVFRLETAGAKPILITGRIEGAAFVGRLRQGALDLPLRLAPVPQLAKPTSRVEGWTQDLDTLATRFLRADRSFSPAEGLLFQEAMATIRSDLPRLNDAQIVSRIAAAVALAGNGHTRLYLLRNRQELRRLPIRLWWFSDGLYVVRAAAAQRGLLGCRVDAIEGVPARIARDRAAPLFAGTPGWRDYKTTYSLTSPETLHGLGIAADMERIRLDLSACKAAGQHILAPLPLLRSRAAVEAWWDLSPRFQAPAEGWAHLLDGTALPLYLRSQANYWFEHQPGTGLLYVQYNRSEQTKDESTEAFGTRLLAEIGRRRPTAFVLDLRFNTGGNLHYAEKLMETLVARTEGMKRFVITGRATFSAGMSAAVPWRRPGVTFVGEAIGEELDYWAEGGNIPLPYSGLDAHFANGFHSYSPAPCPTGIWCLDRSIDSLDPHLPATASFADYKAGRDPAVEAIRAALSQGDRAAR